MALGQVADQRISNATQDHWRFLDVEEGAWLQHSQCKLGHFQNRHMLHFLVATNSLEDKAGNNCEAKKQPARHSPEQCAKLLQAILPSYENG